MGKNGAMVFSFMTIAIQSGGDVKDHHRVDYKLPTCGSRNWWAVKNESE